MTAPTPPWGNPSPAQTPQQQPQAPQGWGPPQASAPQAPQGWGPPPQQQPQQAPAYGGQQGFSQPSTPAPAPAQDTGGFARPPAEGTGAKITDYEGSLLIVQPVRIEQEVKTQNYGIVPATVATVTVLDGPYAGTVQSEVFIFQRQLQGQLRALVGTGREMLGRLGRGTPQHGQGSEPWILLDYTDADLATAGQYKEWQRQQNGGQPPF